MRRSLKVAAGEADLVLERQADFLLASEGILPQEPDLILDRAVSMGVRFASVSDMVRHAQARIGRRHDEDEQGVVQPEVTLPMRELKRIAECKYSAHVRYQLMCRKREQRRQQEVRERTLTEAQLHGTASLRNRLGGRRVSRRDGRKHNLSWLGGENSFRLAFG